MKKHGKWILVCLTIISVISAVLYVYITDTKKIEKEMERSLAEVVEKCESFGVKNITTNISKSQHDDFGYYNIIIYGDGTVNDRSRNFYNFVKETEFIDFSSDITVFDSDIYLQFIYYHFCFNGCSYRLISDNLYKEDELLQYSDEELELIEFYSGKLPYKGMDADHLKYTILGVADEETFAPTKYIWYDVLKYDKVVVDTVVKDNKLVVSDVDFYEKNPSTTTRYSGNTSKNNKDDDPYNAKDYYDAEDFYYDHYDDFYDYYDAEDYFYEHSD